MTGSGVPMGVFECLMVPVELNTVYWLLVTSVCTFKCKMAGRPESLAFKVFRYVHTLWDCDNFACLF